MRLCANVPAQHAIQTALGGYQSIDDLILPGGRLLEQRDVAWTLLNEIPGVSLRQARGRALRVPAARPRGLPRSRTTSSSSSTCCGSEKILVTHGTGFNWPTPDHFRIVTLPWSRDLANAIERLGNFLSSYRQ